MPRLPTSFRTTPNPTEKTWASRQGDARAWYAKPVWRNLRRLVLQRDAYLCQQCGQPAGASAHCDHITPHKGNWELFIDPSNLQCLCHECHSRKTCMEDGGFGNG